MMLNSEIDQGKKHDDLFVGVHDDSSYQIQSNRLVKVPWMIPNLKTIEMI